MRRSGRKSSTFRRAFACSPWEGPRGGRFRLRLNRPATLGRGGGHAQAVFCEIAFVVDRASEGVSLWKFVHAVQAPV